MFGISSFDIIIGNPPYIQLSKAQDVSDAYKIYLKETYKTSAGRLNTFIFFIHSGMQILNKKGVLSYIIPNTILTQDYYQYTREKILKEATLSKIINYEDMPFSNAVVENITFILQNISSENYEINIYKDNFREMQLITKKTKKEFLTSKTFSFNFKNNDLVERIYSAPYRSLEYFCEINQGIALSGDKELSLKRNNKAGKYYRLLDGRNINKYSILWDNVYLDHNLDRIHSCKRKDIFETREKLFFRRVAENLIFTYDDEQFFALNTLIVVNLKTDVRMNLKYLLGILNSKLMNYIYISKFKSTKKVFSEIQARSVKELPIIKPDDSTQKKIIKLVETIIQNKKVDNSFNSKEIESDIDLLVYKIYGLSFDEAALIDPNLDEQQWII